jgi:hypothetical protein
MRLSDWFSLPTLEVPVVVVFGVPSGFVAGRTMTTVALVALSLTGCIVIGLGWYGAARNRADGRASNEEFQDMQRTLPLEVVKQFTAGALPANATPVEHTKAFFGNFFEVAREADQEGQASRNESAELRKQLDALQRDLARVGIRTVVQLPPPVPINPRLRRIAEAVGVATGRATAKGYITTCR